MRKVTRSEMIEKITRYAQDLGLKNAEIAERLNKDFDATRENKMSSAQVAKLKADLGIKGMKPKKKALFELVEDEEYLSECIQEGINEDLPLIEIAQKCDPDISANEEYEVLPVDAEFEEMSAGVSLDSVLEDTFDTNNQF